MRASTGDELSDMTADGEGKEWTMHDNLIREAIDAEYGYGKE